MGLNSNWLFLMILLTVSTVLINGQDNKKSKRGNGIRKATNLSLTDDLISSLINFLMDLMEYGSMAMDYIGQLPVIGRRRRSIVETLKSSKSNDSP
ncbi:unnamed protein product [Callosobruchus maculatus]|uniref:Uncharacterized protein n=1 Tax=Callosobruchus maculatus TaxID=64391 RepID=A0A653DCZ5_CALMS|nr:unnamed protein product [Callosobruchus maculatus]